MTKEPEWLDHLLAKFLEGQALMAAQLDLNFSKSVAGMRIKGALVVPVSAQVAGSQVDSRISRGSGDGVLLGWALRETTGASSASIELHDGTNATAGGMVAPVNLSPGESNREWFAPMGVSYTSGLTLVRVVGSVDGAIFLGAAG